MIPRRWLAGGALCLGACGNFQFNLAVNSTAAVVERGASALDREADVQLARDALPGTIKQLDTFLTAAPEQPVFLALTTQAYAQYAFGFLEDDIESMPDGESPEKKRLAERATGLYDRAYDLAVRWAGLEDKEFPAAARTLATLEARLAVAKKEMAPALYWAGMALGSSINLNRDNIDRVAELPRAVALLKKSHDLDPNYFHRGAAMTLGVVYASQGKAMGGDPDKAKALFTEAIEGTKGQYLMAKVMYARFFGTVTQDRELFENTLKTVLATPPSVDPEVRLANELSHRRAARYLKQADDLF